MKIAIALSILLVLIAAVATPAAGHDLLRLVGLGEPTPAETARSLEADWRERLADGAQSDPASDFENLPRHVFLERIRKAAAEHRFTIERVEFIRAVEDAPLLVVRTAEPARLARDVPQLLRELDPKREGDDAAGWAFEGFFFMAMDESGVPFLVVHNSWRGDTAGGGQWARSEDLYPFPHL